MSCSPVTARSVVLGKVAPLNHEPRYDPMEGGVLVPEALLAGAQGAEVLGRLGDHVGPELQVDGAQHLLVHRNQQGTLLSFFVP